MWFTKRNPVIRFPSSSELPILVIVVKLFHLCQVIFLVRPAAQALQNSHLSKALLLIMSQVRTVELTRLIPFFSFLYSFLVNFSKFYCYVRVSRIPVVILSDDPTRNKTFAKARNLRKFSRADFQSRFPYESYYRYVLPRVLHVQKPVLCSKMLRHL